MKEEILAERYARALLSVAMESGEAEAVEADLIGFVKLLESSERFSEFIRSLIIAESEKKALLEEVLQSLDARRLTGNFLSILVDEGRIPILDRIRKVYSRMVDETCGRAVAQVRTALPLSAERLRKLEGVLGKLSGKKVKMTVEEDPELLGGFLVRIVDKIYDGSVRGRLDALRAALLK